MISDDAVRNRVLNILNSKNYKNIDMIIENSYTKIQLYINSGKFTIDSSECLIYIMTK